ARIDVRGPRRAIRRRNGASKDRRIESRTAWLICGRVCATGLRLHDVTDTNGGAHLPPDAPGLHPVGSKDRHGHTGSAPRTPAVRVSRGAAAPTYDTSNCTVRAYNRGRSRGTCDAFQMNAGKSSRKRRIGPESAPWSRL